MRHSSVFAIILAGFASTVAQVIILRELLVLFYGNELSSGLVLGCWLFWTAMGSGLGGVLSRRLPPRPDALALSMLSLGALLPLTVLFIRAFRVIWNIPLGEIVLPGAMFAISFTATSFLCATSGFLFAFAWRVYVAAPEGKAGEPTLIYMGEAAGAALAGIVFYLILLPRLSAFGTALLTAAIMIGGAFPILWRYGAMHDSNMRFYGIGTAALMLIAVVSFSVSDLDGMSRRWQWGADVVTVRDTPYHNLALLKNAQQFTLFANGQWLFSVPDPQSAEYAVHPALLQHPDPRSVLLIGGGAAGLVSEILKHPSVDWVDYVESDPEIIRMAQEFLPAEVSGSIRDGRVHVVHADASSFVRNAPRNYDVVLLNVGDPVNAETNRFYTAEFFGRIKELMNPTGVFSFAASSSPDIIGRAQARLLRSLYATLRSVFPAVLVYPGEQARFLANDGFRSLVKDPKELVRRIHARGLELQYVREYYLFSNLSPLRMDYMASILNQGRSTVINKDFEPTCYFDHLIVWSAQLHPGLERAFEAMTAMGRSKFWVALAIGLICVLGVFFVGRPKPNAAVALSVVMVGGALMFLELVLLLGFQILEGFLYAQLALIISSFMSGMALGAAGAAGLFRRSERARFWLVGVQTILCFYVLGVLLVLIGMQRNLRMGHYVPMSTSLLFSILALLAGLFGGLHFSLALKTVSAEQAPSAETAGRFYALDLVGAAAGAILVSLFLLPVYGLITTVWAVAILLAVGLVTLLRNA